MDATCLGSPAASDIAPPRSANANSAKSLLPQRVGRFYRCGYGLKQLWRRRADAILRQLDAEADSTSIEVTLYLPWGMATGITVAVTA